MARHGMCELAFVFFITGADESEVYEMKVDTRDELISRV
jgi:hypothetical protein